MNTLFKCFIALFVLSSCDNQGQIESTEDTGKEVSVIEGVVDLKIDTINISSEILIAIELLVNKNYLISVDSRPKREFKAFKVFKRPEMEYLGSFGSKGDGPNEFNNMLQTSILLNEEELIAADLKHVRFYSLSGFEKALRNKSVRSYRKERVPGSLMPLNLMIVLNDSLIGGQKDFFEKEYAMFNTNTGYTFGLASYPQLRENIPDKAAHHLYQYYSKQKPDQTKIASAYVNFPCVKVYDLETASNTMGCVSPKNQQVENIQVGPREMSINSFELFKYNKRLKVNNQLLVALYIESKIIEVADKDKPNRFSYQDENLTPKYFQVFDWEANHLLSLEIPNWVETYAVSPDHQIYFLHPEVSDKIFKIDLNHYLSF